MTTFIGLGSNTEYVVTVYQTVTGRWAWRSPQGRGSNGSWATRAYAVKVAERKGFLVAAQDEAWGKTSHGV